MGIIKKLYFDFYLLVYALYALFNKGIAYSYLSEVVLVLGVLLIIYKAREYEFVWDRRMAMLIFFISVTVLYMFRGVAAGYGVMDVVRDSVMFNYIAFALIIYLFKDDLAYFKQGLFRIYKWYPSAMCCFFLLSSYIPSIYDIKLFGGFSLFLYKFGDMGVHLLISTLFFLNGYIKVSRRFFAINFLLIVYLFLIVSSYARTGMVSYLFAMGMFFLFSKNSILKKQLIHYLKLTPIIVLLALPLYVSTNLEENFQGRKLGLEQLKDNALSIFGVESSNNVSLSDNKVWRLVWWAKIIDYTFMGPEFAFGKGLGMSLALDDDIGEENTTELNDLRSPHNFHFTVLARFGVPFFFLWLYWICLHAKRIRKRDLDPFVLTLICISFAFLVNASFDVFLEGPMGAFPFWTMIGLTYATEAFTKKEAEIPAVTAPS
jgi:hypothetical protein